MTPPRKPLTAEARKNVLYTMFAQDMGRLIAPHRITPQMIQSKEWREMRKKFYELLEPVLLEQEEGRANE